MRKALAYLTEPVEQDRWMYWVGEFCVAILFYQEVVKPWLTS